MQKRKQKGLVEEHDLLPTQKRDFERALKEFNQVVRMVEMVEEMKDLMNPADLELISKGLKKLLDDEHSIYNDYLKKTENIYGNSFRKMG